MTSRNLEFLLKPRVPDRIHGREEFRVCAACHDVHDAGLPKGWVPEIAGQHPHVIVKELVDFRHGDRWDLRMEVIAGRHVLKSSQDIADVAAYVASLSPVDYLSRLTPQVE